MLLTTPYLLHSSLMSSRMSSYSSSSFNSSGVTCLKIIVNYSVTQINLICTINFAFNLPYSISIVLR